MLPRAHAFCLRCRAMLDEGQSCECADEGAHVGLARGRDAIEEALLEVPHVDRADTTQRLILTMIIGPGAVGVVLSVMAALFVLAGLVPNPETAGWVFGVPFALITLSWLAFFIWSELQARMPNYPGVVEPAPAADEGVVTAEIVSGAIDVVELRQEGDRPLVIRDAVAVEPLVLKRPGQRIEVPAGRLRVELPPEKLRGTRGDELGLDETWKGIPEKLGRAGRLYRARLERGARVELLEGELEDLDEREASFREAAEDRARFQPKGKRVRIRTKG